MNSWNFRILVITIFMGIQISTKCQNVDMQSWNALVIDWNYTQSWLVELELDYNRLLSEGPEWREYAVLPMIEYYPDNSIDLLAGVYLSNTKQNSTLTTQEVRPLIGLRWNIIKPEKRVFLRTQVKYEYRIFKNISSNENTNSGRMRFRIDLFVPFTKQSYLSEQNLYGIFLSELFGNMDDNIGERFHSSFRQHLGVGYRFTYKWRIEIVYVFQASRDSSEDNQADNLNNVIFASLKYFIR